MTYTYDTTTGKTRELILKRLELEDTGQMVDIEEETGWSGGCDTCGYDTQETYIRVDGATMKSFYQEGAGAVIAWIMGDND